MTIPERIKMIRAELCGGSNIKFAELMGETTQVTSNWIGGKRNIGLDVIERILNKFPNVNSSWLISGDGEMLQNEKKVVSLPEVGTQLELDFSKVADACQKAATAAEESARTTRILAEDNSKVLNQLITSIDRLEKKIDQKGAAEDAKNVVKREDHG